MRKITLLIVCVSIVLSCFAQNSTEHMTFKGIPIDGTITDFTAKMKQKGFTHLGTQDGVALFTGEFAATKDCTVGVVSSKTTNVVNKVAVFFPDCDTWSRLYGNYSQLKTMLTQKYGEPTENVERFDGYSEPHDDGDRMYRVQFDECKYVTIWETEKGDIELAIDHDDVSSCFVRLSYWDKNNTEKVTNSAIDDL